MKVRVKTGEFEGKEIETKSVELHIDYLIDLGLLEVIPERKTLEQKIRKAIEVYYGMALHTDCPGELSKLAIDHVLELYDQGLYEWFKMSISHKSERWADNKTTFLRQYIEREGNISNS